MMNLASLSPIEIDTELARLWGATSELELRLRREENLLAKVGRGDRGYTHYDADKIRVDIDRLTAELDVLKAEALPFELEYADRPWKRYFLVTNNNGHVHRGMDCTTCFYDTSYAWLIDLADCDEDAMIEEWGEKACTVCFPTAPVNPFYHRPARVDREARELRDAEKAKKAADKNEKAITDVDGEPLRVGYNILRTKVAARNALSGAVKDLAMYGPDHPEGFLAHIRKLIPALEAAGVETAPVIDRAIKASVKEDWNHAGQVADMIAGVELTEAIESGNDLRIVEAVEKLGATVTHRPSPYGPWFRITFPVGPREAAGLALAASVDETDGNVSVLLADLARRFFDQAEGLEGG